MRGQRDGVLMQIFDAHFHIIDKRFALVTNRGFLPDEFGCDDYFARTKGLGVVGGAIVSGSFQAFDQSYLKLALRRLGPAFVGVTQLPAAVSDDELLELDKAGVRAVRFNLFRGGSLPLEELEDVARRVHETVGWHVELYVDASELDGMLWLLASLPTVVIDHLGLSKAGLPNLCKLVALGAYVKASGFGRLDFDPIPAIRDLTDINPASVMFGTDLPSTRVKRPFQQDDIEHVRASLGPELADRVFFENAVSLYRPFSY